MRKIVVKYLILVKLGQKGQKFAFAILKSTPAWKKYTTNGCMTNMRYARRSRSLRSPRPGGETLRHLVQKSPRAAIARTLFRNQWNRHLTPFHKWACTILMVVVDRLWGIGSGFLLLYRLVESGHNLHILLYVHILDILGADKYSRRNMRRIEGWLVALWARADKHF